MKSRGILYYVWGDYDCDDLNRSIATAEDHGIDYHVEEATVDLVKYRNRRGLFKASPFDLTLHLDTDTFIKGDLSYGFEMADQHGIACCIAPASNSRLASPDKKFAKKIPEDLPQYNMGVVFYDKQDGYVKRVFGEFKDLLGFYPESSQNDQPFFAYAMHKLGFNPYVLPMTWNYRPHLRYTPQAYHGELKIVHSKTDVA